VLVDTVPGQGTTFKVLIPTHPEPAAISKSVERPTVELRGHGELILLVEDEPAVRTLLTNALQQHGYRVIGAESGPEAVRLWRDHGSSVALLLSDMIMPGDLTGAELAGRLRALKPSLRIILSSGHGVGVMEEASSGQPDVTFLAKPYTIDHLLRTVASVLGAANDTTTP
jgi:CheY-like chemotaxis protein